MFDIDPKEYFAEALKTAGWDRVYRKGEPIPMDEEPGDYIYFIIRGKVAHMIHDSMGGDNIILLLSDGDIFGEDAMFGGGRSLTASEPLEDSMIKRVPKGEFAELLSRDGDLYLAVIKSLTRKSRRLVMDLMDISFDNAYRRVAIGLLMFADMYGEDQERDEPVTLEIGPAGICSMTGAGMESTEQVLNEFSRLGILELGDRSVTINSPGALREWADLTVEKLFR